MGFRLPYLRSGRRGRANLRSLLGLGSLLSTGYGDHSSLYGDPLGGWKHVRCELDHLYWLRPEEPYLGKLSRCKDHPRKRLYPCGRCAQDGHHPPQQ